MNKRLWLNTLCCLSMLSGSVFAEPSSSEMVHAVLGSRKAPNTEYSVTHEKRLASSEDVQAKGIREEKAVFEPSDEMLLASRCCRSESENEKTLNVNDGDELKKKARYYTTHPNALHFVTAVTQPYGDPVQLEDGSIWSLYTGDSYKTLNWLTTDNILILPNRNPVWNSIYPYCLLNQQTGVSVQGTYSAAPWVNSGYSRWIYSIDYYNCQLCLNDGSVWNVPFCDSWILNTFLPGDYVTMGFNDTPNNGLGANILINFSIMQYVYSTCILY